MITGTIVISLFTANVTAVLTTKNVAALQNVLGQKVELKAFYRQGHDSCQKSHTISGSSTLM